MACYDSNMHNSRSHQPPVDSPLDPFMVEFLALVRDIDTGFGPTANGRSISERLGVDPAFVEGLTTSARKRRLIEAFYAPAHRNTLRWRLSPRGEAFLAEHGRSLTSNTNQDGAINDRGVN